MCFPEWQELDTLDITHVCAYKSNASCARLVEHDMNGAWGFPMNSIVEQMGFYAMWDDGADKEK